MAYVMHPMPIDPRLTVGGFQPTMSGSQPMPVDPQLTTGATGATGANTAAPQKKKKNWRPGKLVLLRHTIMRKAHAFHQRTGARMFIAIEFNKRFYAYTSEPKPSPKAILKEQQRKPCRRCQKRGREDEFPPKLSYIRNTIRRDIWHAEDLEGIPLQRQFIKPNKRSTALRSLPARPHGQPTPVTAPQQPKPVVAPQQPAPAVAAQNVPAMFHEEPLRPGHEMSPAPPEAGLHHAQPARAITQGQEWPQHVPATSYEMPPTPPESHPRRDQHAHTMAQGQSVQPMPIAPPPNSPTTPDEQLLRTGIDTGPTGFEHHPCYDQQPQAMAQEPSLHTNHNTLFAGIEPHDHDTQCIPSTPYGNYPHVGQSAYSTPPGPPMQSVHPNHKFRTGQYPFLEAPHQAFQPGGYLQPGASVVPIQEFIPDTPANTADQFSKSSESESSESSDSSESSESSQSSDSSDESDSGDDNMLNNPDSPPGSSTGGIAEQRPSRNLPPSSEQAGNFASPINLCTLDESDDSDSISSSVEDPIASSHHINPPHTRSRSRAISIPDSNSDSMDIDSSSSESRSPAARHPRPKPNPLPSHGRCTVRGSIKKPSRGLSPLVHPPGRPRPSRRPGRPKTLQRGIGNDILSARAAGSRRPVLSTRQKAHPPSKPARITRSQTASRRRSDSLMVDEDHELPRPTRAPTIEDEMGIPSPTPQADVADKASPASREEDPARQGLPPNLRRVEFYIPIKTVAARRATLMGKHQ